MAMLNGRPILSAIATQDTSRKTFASFLVGRIPNAPKNRMNTAGRERVERLNTLLLSAVSVTAALAASFDVPTTLFNYSSLQTLIPF